GVKRPCTHRDPIAVEADRTQCLLQKGQAGELRIALTVCRFSPAACHEDTGRLLVWSERRVILAEASPVCGLPGPRTMRTSLRDILCWRRWRKPSTAHPY